MGAEVQCTVHYRRKASEGRALLESDTLLFRGGFRLAIPFATVRSVEASRGRLKVAFPGGVASFELGPRAERWAQSIRAPKRLVDKLGVKPDSRVVVLGIEDAEFWAQLDIVGVVAASSVVGFRSEPSSCTVLQTSFSRLFRGGRRKRRSIV